MPNPRKQDRELDALYATLPRLDCQGYCHDSCGPLDMSVRERARIVERARKPLTCHKGGLCTMLSEDHRCTVYDVRPLICRLWGLVKAMRCHYGCVPERWLTNNEAARLMVAAERIGGSPLGDRAERTMQHMLDSLSEEQLAAMTEQSFGHSLATIEGITVVRHRTGQATPFERPSVPYGTHAVAFARDNDKTGDGQ